MNTIEGLTVLAEELKKKSSLHKENVILPLIRHITWTFDNDTGNLITIVSDNIKEDEESFLKVAGFEIFHISTLDEMRIAPNIRVIMHAQAIGSGATGEGKARADLPRKVAFIINRGVYYEIGEYEDEEIKELWFRLMHYGMVYFDFEM